MNPEDIPHDTIIVRKNVTIPSTYDVEMDILKGYTSIECHITLYPYSRRIHSHHITFSPFEEYVKDILSHQRSAYAEITSQFNKFFGLLLGFVIVLLFFVFKREELFSIQSVVSIFGAYLVGKEFWDDMERILINISKRWSLQYVEPSYLYQLEKDTTITQYTYLAKKRRYGKAHLLPQKIDFIQQSNSQSVRMYFAVKDFTCEGPAHILSVCIEPEVLEDFEKEGFMVGLKLSFNRKFLFIVSSFELFQSIDGGSRGCLNGKNQWVGGAAFYRKTATLGKIKYFRSEGILPDTSIMRWE